VRGKEGAGEKQSDEFVEDGEETLRRETGVVVAQEKTRKRGEKDWIRFKNFND